MLEVMNFCMLITKITFVLLNFNKIWRTYVPNNSYDSPNVTCKLPIKTERKWIRSMYTRVFNLIANVNKQLIAYFGQTQLIAIL